MIWKTVTLIVRLIKPNKEISNEEKNAIQYPTNNTNLIKLSNGLYFNEITKNNKLWTIILAKNTVTPFLLSPVLLEAYSIILSEVKPRETIDKNQLKERIKKEIEDFISQDKIFFIYNMSQRGLTLADGSVLINYNNTDEVANAACCLMTIFHEMTHVLFRKIIYTNTFSFNKNQDSGIKIEELLVGEFHKCHKEGCYFILNFKNYQLYELKKFNSLFASEEINCIQQDKTNTTKTYVLYKKTERKASCVISH